MDSRPMLEELVNSLHDIEHFENDRADWDQCPCCRATTFTYGGGGTTGAHEPDCVLEKAKRYLNNTRKVET